MRKRKTSHQPNFKATRTVVLGKDGVGKSGIYWLVSSGVKLVICFVNWTFHTIRYGGQIIYYLISTKLQFSPLRVHELL